MSDPVRDVAWYWGALFAFAVLAIAAMFGLYRCGVRELQCDVAKECVRWNRADGTPCRPALERCCQ